MLKRIKTLASLYRELGLRWSAFRLAYAFRHRSGLIRLQMPLYKWTDRPLATWLKKNIPSESTSYAEWRKANAPKFSLCDDTGGRERGRFSRAYRDHLLKKLTASSTARSNSSPTNINE
ncbi:MAG: hypothetical protein IPO22_06570 [Anaerolineales bacterium]|nr:hypothetical protein [Anaerolineales bacterium]